MPRINLDQIVHEKGRSRIKQKIIMEKSKECAACLFFQAKPFLVQHKRPNAMSRMHFISFDPDRITYY